MAHWDPGQVGGEHWWYNRDGVTSGCYHCEIVRPGQLWKTSGDDGES